jgi:hypothetical protein
MEWWKTRNRIVAFKIPVRDRSQSGLVFYVLVASDCVAVIQKWSTLIIKGDTRMNRLFECLEANFFKVPDGTLVNPFLNPKDIMSGLPWDILDGLSIAAGYINPGDVSEIHVHSFISQITLLVSGALDIHMKDPGNADAPYILPLKLPTPTGKPGFTTAATLGSPGTFFQLDNSRGSEPARVLYLAIPSYLYEPGKTPDAPPIYDDAVTVGSDWKRLADLNWNPPELCDPARSYAARQNALQRLAKRSRTGSPV